MECQIVGVYADARSRGTDDPHQEVALPFWQMPWPAPRVAIRTVADPFAVRRSVESIVRSLDPELPLAEVKTLEQVVSESLDGDRQGLGDVLLGIVLGGGGAWYAARALRGVVYGVESPGAGPFVVVVLTLLGAAVVACTAPALRAASVDPVEALRQE